MRERLPIDREGLKKRGKGIVEAADMDAVVAMAIHELYKLHEGNIARFGLRLNEYRTRAEHLRRWEKKPANPGSPPVPIRLGEPT